MNKTELTPKDLDKAIQFLKKNSIDSKDVNLGRLVGWINASREHSERPRYRVSAESPECEPKEESSCQK